MSDSEPDPYAPTFSNGGNFLQAEQQSGEVSGFALTIKQKGGASSVRSDISFVIPLYVDSEKATFRKWEKVNRAHAGYAFAEESEYNFVPKRFPNSIYGRPDQILTKGYMSFNNSNTYGRYILNAAGISTAGLSNHTFPGNTHPEVPRGTWSDLEQLSTQLPQ